MAIPFSPLKQNRLMAGIVFFLSIMAFLAAFHKNQEVEPDLGGFMIWAAIIEIIHGFRRASVDLRTMAWKSASVSIFIGILLINASLLITSALAIFVAISVLVDAVIYVRHALKEQDVAKRNRDWLAAAGNFAVILIMLIFQQRGIHIAIAIAVGLRIFGTALNILSAPLGKLEHVSEDIMASMNTTENKEIVALAEKIEKEETLRAVIDRNWIITFILVLFFIHLGRMGFDRSRLGILSPLLAVVGDMAIALIITYGIRGPILNSFRRLSSPAEAALWKWVQKVPPEDRNSFSLRTVTFQLLTLRLTTRIRIRKSGYSLKTATRTGLKLGLPWAALLAAIMPVLGMSWYFDTENWASGVWDSWAAKRTDTWREKMAVSTGLPFNASAYRMNPEGVKDNTDFSFVVVGDPGEGDASQLILKDMVVKVSNDPGVKFVVISSDVIYPTGAMKDYERKFYLPMKGVTKPVYAIPGNHDWYDALEGFVANFYEPGMAKKSLKARIESDLRLSTTTDSRIDGLISSAETLRKEYGVPTGFQQAPYFQVCNNNFVLICLDTGIKRQLDSLEMTWLKSVLEQSKGKFVMALLGHPFYAIGEYQGVMNPEFEKLHALLKSYHVPVVMAGDTHDLEYYKEIDSARAGQVMHHFVNGGGGAYLSIGTAMAKAENMPTKDYAFYPSNAPLVKKIETNTSWYKYPAWWYTRKFDGWPFSAEWLSAAFDYNVSPFFQSFMEIRVEKSKNRVLFVPYSQNGRLRWKDITSTEGARINGSTPDDLAEWSMPLTK